MDKTKKEKQDAYDRTLKRRFTRAQLSAKKAGRVFSLSFEVYEQLLLQNTCTYCGGELNQTGSGLDRIDSKLGYTKANSVACCFKCNTMKSNLTMEEFFKHIKKVMEYVKL